MVTVLKGKSVEELKKFLEQHGTKSSFFQNNPDAVLEWIKLLKVTTGPTYDNAPLEWIQKMLQHARESRPDAATVYEMTTSDESSPDPDAIFCGSCCNQIDSSEDANTHQETKHTEDARDPDPGTTSDNPPVLSAGLLAPGDEIFFGYNLAQVSLFSRDPSLR